MKFSLHCGALPKSVDRRCHHESMSQLTAEMFLTSLIYPIKKYCGGCCFYILYLFSLTLFKNLIGLKSTLVPLPFHLSSEYREKAAYWSNHDLEPYFNDSLLEVNFLCMRETRPFPSKRFFPNIHSIHGRWEYTTLQITAFSHLKITLIFLSKKEEAALE